MDCIILYEVLTVFHTKLRELGLGLHLKSYSIPGLAFKAFKMNYLTPNTVVNLLKRFIRDEMGHIGEGRGYYYDVKGMGCILKNGV